MAVVLKLRAARDTQVCRGTSWNFWKSSIRITIRHAGKHSRL